MGRSSERRGEYWNTRMASRGARKNRKEYSRGQGTLSGLGSSQKSDSWDMNLRILAAASRDLVKGNNFYERQEEGLGGYFLDTLYSAIDSWFCMLASIEKSEAITACFPSAFPMRFITKQNRMRFECIEWWTADKIPEKHWKHWRSASSAEMVWPIFVRFAEANIQPTSVGRRKQCKLP